MEHAIAQLRVAIVILAGAAFFGVPHYLSGNHLMTMIWGAGLMWAGLALVVQPYRRVPLFWWDVVSGVVDWVVITVWIVVTGGVHSDFYLLYFLATLSIAMRYGLREVLLAGLGIACGYLAMIVATTHGDPQGLHVAALRMGHLLLFAVGSGVLARETNRHFQARIKEEAQRLAVQEMTATVSHDLTNPLSAVSGLVEMLLESAPETLSLEQRALLHSIDANTQQMTNLVANLLDAEMLERGRQSFRPAQVDVNALVRRVVEAQAHQAETKHIGLVLDLSQRLPVALLDGRMIERLLANLLSNAVKFTPESGAIRVSTRGRDSRVIIEVWDSGPDVPAPLRSVLFEKFMRQKDSSGLGLGLYICKSIVDAHHGKIEAHRSGDGVAFVVELPVVSIARPEPQPDIAAAGERYVWQMPVPLNADASR